VERKWGVTDRICCCQLEQKRESRAGCGPYSDVKTWSSQARFCVRARSSQTCIEVETEATHACILMLKCDPEVRVLKSSTTEGQHDYRIWHRTQSWHHVVDEVRV